MIKMIWAEDLDHGIAKDGIIPWHLKSEMQFFKNTTLNHVVVMGLKTYQTIGKPLINRTNVVLTSQDLAIPGIEIFHNIEDVLEKFHHQDIFIIGGKSVYEQFFSKADELIISRLDQSYDCDVFLNFNLQDFKLIKEENHPEFKVFYYLRKK